MLKTYFKIAWRNLTKNKIYSFINIGGLSVGLAVAILIGLWIHDELSFNKNNKNYNNIAQVWQFVTFEVEKSSYDVLPIPLAQELKTKYPDFKYVSLSKSQEVILTAGDKNFLKSGNYVEPDFLKMMSVPMLAGQRNGLAEPNSIMLSNSLAKNLFADENPINKLVSIDNKATVKVTGVYEDFPDNSTFKNVSFIGPWAFHLANDESAKGSADVWDNNSWQIYAQVNDGADFKAISAKIKDIRMKKENPPGYKPEFFLHPMSRWHLYSDFKNGENTGGLIQFVWLFGIIGIFVLLLASINFMNLSTARSEKRAKEVGIRKAIGSVRKQLVVQFLAESLLVAFIAFLLSLSIVQLILPFFNGVSGKKMSVLWASPVFWALSVGCTLLTGLIAGSYPALYLSSFNPIKALKGTFKASRFAAIPRKVLVVVQFTVSVTLVIGTIIVFKQIEYAKDRPLGYDRSGLIEINMRTPELAKHFSALRNDLIKAGAVTEAAESSGSITEQSGGTTDVSWKGKPTDTKPLIMSNFVSHEYGKTISWQISAGRDFSRTFADSTSIILNEAAVKLMGFKSPLDQTIKGSGKDYRVIGVVKDMVKESPFTPVKPSIFIVNYRNVSVISLRLSPKMGTAKALATTEAIIKKYNPASPFEYKFADEKYGQKFFDEERIGKLASFFTMLAVLISCLGLFGLASFVAEQRTKEIGVRKVLGASVFNVWQLLSKDFALLVVISVIISIPVASYFMHNWLKNYEYRMEISWWIFAAAGLGALVITLLTVSFQSIKAALSNPVKSLRSE
jgi:putative ABC transport system permease protein